MEWNHNLDLQIYDELSHCFLVELKTKFWNNRTHLFSDSYKCYATKKSLNEFVSTRLPEFLISDGIYGSEDCVIQYRGIHRGITTLNIHGSKDRVQQIKNLLENNFRKVHASIEWVYNVKGQSLELPINNDNYPLKEYYSFLNNQSLVDFYESYMSSNASILILIGPPGTGKTTFIRGLLQHTNSNALVSYDPKVLDNDDFFANFIENDDIQILILEDADVMLTPRKDGNPLMMKFLNVGDGLVSCSNKKIIFTTNLPSTKEIDTALTRPGRCHNILEFGPLPIEQAKLVATQMNLELNLNDSVKSLTLAEIFNHKPFSTSIKPKPVGFIK
jgi:hypothetical protein